MHGRLSPPETGREEAESGTLRGCGALGGSEASQPVRLRVGERLFGGCHGDGSGVSGFTAHEIQPSLGDTCFRIRTNSSN